MESINIVINDSGTIRMDESDDIDFFKNQGIVEVVTSDGEWSIDVTILKPLKRTKHEEKGPSLPKWEKGCSLCL